MTEEEKKAIEYCEKAIIARTFWCYEAIPNIQIILNIIEKQQKRINELEKQAEYSIEKINSELSGIRRELNDMNNPFMKGGW